MVGRSRIVQLFSFSILFSIAFLPAVSATSVGFAKTWGSTNSDFGNQVITDSAGNLYVSGVYNLSFGIFTGSSSASSLLVKYSPSGGLQWVRSWGGQNSSVLAFGLGLADDSQGGIYQGDTAVFYSRSGGYRAVTEWPLILKINATGDLVWERTWSENQSSVAGVATDSLGNLYVAGSMHIPHIGPAASEASAIFLLKVNSMGDLVWQRMWEASGFDYAGGITLNPNGFIYVAGTYNLTDANPGIVLLKFDSLGGLVHASAWNVGTGPAQLSSNFPYISAGGIAADSSGDIYLTGNLNIFTAPTSLFLMKVNPTGGVAWIHNWIGYASFAGSVSVTKTGMVLVIGATSLPSGSTAANRVLLLSVSSGGSLLSHAIWGTPMTNSSDGGTGVTSDASGSAILTGAVGEKPPYSLTTIANSSFGTPSYSVISQSGSTTNLNQPLIAHTDPFSIPSGNETYSGQTDVLLLKLNIGSSSATLPTGVLLVLVLVPLLLVVRRYNGRTANADMKGCRIP